MGWGTQESRIEEHRDAISRDPALAVEKITADLARASRPRDRVRLLAMLAAAHRHKAEKLLMHRFQTARGRSAKRTAQPATMDNGDASACSL